MEKFEINEEKSLEMFSSFIHKAKGAFIALIDNIKTNIRDYEVKIEETAKEISDNEISREKCEHEITKMEGRIDSIKDAIENVESTYKKMVDAYSSTSKGETKDLYSEIIDGAKANCEKDVEKNRSEIARLNSDIEAIKNNISEFTKIIDELNRDLDNYNTELFRYTKGLEYFEKISEDSSVELEDISIKKEETPKKETKSKKGESKKSSSKSKTVEKVQEEKPTTEKKTDILDTFEPESFETEDAESTEDNEEKRIANEFSYEDSLKQIYDLTGYKPTQQVEEPKKEEKVAPVEEQPVFTDNLENLFSTPTQDVPVKEEKQNDEISFLDTEFSSWESILNSSSVPVDESSKEVETKSIVDNMDDTANQLLSPYGTSMARLRSIVGKEITYKNGDKVPFELTSQDVIMAVNSVDGNDLKKMKTVGPEITLLRKVKEMKEGNR